MRGYCIRLIGVYESKKHFLGQKNDWFLDFVSKKNDGEEKKRQKKGKVEKKE